MVEEQVQLKCQGWQIVVLAVVKATVVEVVDAAVSTYTENRSKG